MSEEQQKFDELMKKVIKVSPEELKRRLQESKTIKQEQSKKEIENKISILLVAWEISDSGKAEELNKTLAVKLASLGGTQIQKSLWTIRTEMSVAYTMATLRDYVAKEDRLLVAEIADILSKNGINLI